MRMPMAQLKLITMILIYTLLGIIILIFTLLYFYQEKLIFYPEKIPPDYKYIFDNDFIEINYKIDKKTTLNALLFKADNSKGLVFYLHGNAGNLISWGHIAPQFIDNNYDLLIIDYRGYGKSTGKLSEKTLFSDGQFIYNQIKKDYKEDNIIIYGRSIGTGIATYLASNNKPKQLILEAPSYNMIDLAKKFYPWFPKFLIRYPLRTDRYIKNVDCPIFIFHGTIDNIIYYKSSLKLKQFFKDTDKLFLIKGGNHNDLSFFESYNYHLNEILK